MTQKEIAIAHEVGHMLGRYIWSGNIDNVEYFTISTDGDGYTHSTNKRLSDYLRTHNHSLKGFINESDAMNVIVGQMFYALGGMVMERVYTGYTDDISVEAAQGAAADLQQLQQLIVNEIGLDQTTFDRLQNESFALLDFVYRQDVWFETAQKFVKYISRQCKPNKVNKFKPKVFYSFFPRQNPNDPVEILNAFRSLWNNQNP